MRWNLLKERTYLSPTKHWYGLYRCQCGTEREVNMSHVRNGRSKSCGCHKREVSRKICAERAGPNHPSYRHGLRRSKIHNCWAKMKDRCFNPNNEAYRNYGGRGITVCERWLSFDNFLADMGQPPGPQYSIDRINNYGNYEPGNCRWATRKQQANNRRTCRAV